ncbi:MinD/ParA family ATP-binding protein [Dactylosporangium sp. CS-033363]|uniref:MinD/ParA family ATP-binding protein n=1 Tax=Dactylosporangium sp. CS-033363 TaxID=3239935 RepID=UPI003D8A5151
MLGPDGRPIAPPPPGAPNYVPPGQLFGPPNGMPPGPHQARPFDSPPGTPIGPHQGPPFGPPPATLQGPPPFGAPPGAPSDLPPGAHQGPPPATLQGPPPFGAPPGAPGDLPPGAHQGPPPATLQGPPPFGAPPGAPNDMPPGAHQGPPLGPPPGALQGPPPFGGPPAGHQGPPPFGQPPGAHQGPPNDVPPFGPPQDNPPGGNPGPIYGPPPGAPNDVPPGPNYGPPPGAPNDLPPGVHQAPPNDVPPGQQPGPNYGPPPGAPPNDMPPGQIYGPPHDGQPIYGQPPYGQQPYGAPLGYADPQQQGQHPNVPPLPPMPQNWHDGKTPTAEEFARRRQAKPADPIASRGVRGALAKGTMGLVNVAPGRREMEYRQEVEMVRRNFGGLRQVTVVNPKGGAGKTVAVLLLAMTFGQKRGGYVLAWDNNETQGTLGMRAQQDFHNRTVRDLLHDLGNFRGAQGRVGDLSQYVRAQGEGMFDVLASDESATAGEMLTSSAFGEIRDIVSRFYKLIVVDTGNNVRAENWQAAIDATDQLVVTMSARNDSAETASRMLDHLEQHGRQRLVRQAVTVVSMPPSRRHVDVPAITKHFAARTRTVLIVPYERFIDSGEPIRYPGLSAASREAWLKVAASVSEGL